MESKNQNPQEISFMAHVQAAKNMQPAWHANALLYTVAGLFAFLILWASLAEVEILTRGEGQVVPTSDIQIVQSLEGGILRELNVQEGDRVTKGQVLARIGNVAFLSGKRGIEAQKLSLQLKQARLNAEIQSEAFTVPGDLSAQNEALAENELKLYQSRADGRAQSLAAAEENVKRAQANLQENEARIDQLRQSAMLLEEQLKITRDLVAKNAMPKLEALKQERELNDADGQLKAAMERKKSLEAELASAENTRDEKANEFRSQALAELSEVEMQLSALQESLTAAGDRVDRTELRAPVDGVVKTVAQKTLGGIVEPAMKVIEIVPLGEDLKITAKIQPADIAFLEVGQDVNVKITAYDSTKFGALRGKLTRISADTIEDKDGEIFFEIDAVTDKNYLGSRDNPLPIIPGMVAQVEVITGYRSIMSYLLKPFLRARDTALTEQ